MTELVKFTLFLQFTHKHVNKDLIIFVYFLLLEYLYIDVWYMYTPYVTLKVNLWMLIFLFNESQDSILYNTIRSNLFNEHWIDLV